MIMAYALPVTEEAIMSIYIRKLKSVQVQDVEGCYGRRDELSIQ